MRASRPAARGEGASENCENSFGPVAGEENSRTPFVRLIIEKEDVSHEMTPISQSSTHASHSAVN